VLEVGVDHTIGESFTANTDTFKYTVTSQLVHNQVTIDDTRLLELVRDDATDEMGLRGVQRLHQSVELFLRVDIERSSNQRPIQIFSKREKRAKTKEKRGNKSTQKKTKKLFDDGAWTMGWSYQNGGHAEWRDFCKGSS